jgi:hypothetical protein
MDQHELSLVIKALKSGLSNCVEWHEGAATRVRNDSGMQGWTPEAVRREVLAFVATDGEVIQVDETRENWLDRYAHWYKAVIPLAGFRRGVFVEMRLVDEDEDVPIVHLVNAHPQT